jgi:hypothetical protein
LVHRAFTASPRESPATVLPLRGGQAHVPAARLVAVALARAGEIDRGLLRNAIAVVETLAEQGRAGTESERYWWERPVIASVTSIASRAGLLAGEVDGALGLLVETAVLSGTATDGWRISREVLCEEPSLAGLDWITIRQRLAAARARTAPVLAVLRELVRIASAGEWEAPLAVRIGELCESSLYGRSAVTSALADLENARLVERTSGTTRQGVQLRLQAAVWGKETVPVSPAHSSVDAPRPPVRASDSYVEEVSFGEHRIEIPVDTPLRILPQDDGGTRVEFGPLIIETDPDGTQVATCGGLRITRRPQR